MITSSTRKKMNTHIYTLNTYLYTNTFKNKSLVKPKQHLK